MKVKKSVKRKCCDKLERAMMASDRAKEKAHRSELLSKGVEIHGLKRFGDSDCALSFFC
ncbi:hypothetical protein FORC37_1959 [Vibrio vulnificus]|nr:hypothetical protein FORC37_1959 [Vibrio vulnificus]